MQFTESFQQTFSESTSVMPRSTSHWFDWPKEELSATELARRIAKRASRLEPHLLPTPTAPAPAPRAPSPAGRGTRWTDQRDPFGFESGVEVEYLSDCAYDRLFAPNAADKT
jgi:hypothetical protein